MGGCPSEAKRSRPKLWVLGALRLQTTPGGAGERVPWCHARQYQIFPRIFALSVYTTLEMAILTGIAGSHAHDSPRAQGDTMTALQPDRHSTLPACDDSYGVRLAAIATPQQGYATLAWAIATDQLAAYLVRYATKLRKAIGERERAQRWRAGVPRPMSAAQIFEQDGMTLWDHYFGQS